MRQKVATLIDFQHYIVPFSIFLIICCLEVFFASIIACVMLITLLPMSYLVLFRFHFRLAAVLLVIYFRFTKKYDKTVSEGFEGRFTLTMMHSTEPSSKVTPPGGHG